MEIDDILNKIENKDKLLKKELTMLKEYVKDLQENSVSTLKQVELLNKEIEQSIKYIIKKRIYPCNDDCAYDDFGYCDLRWDDDNIENSRKKCAIQTRKYFNRLALKELNKN